MTTGAQFDALPYEEGRLWELVDGDLIPAPNHTVQDRADIQKLLFPLMLHFKAHPEHGAVLHDVEFAPEENCRVRPDVFVLRPERVANLDWQKVPVPGAPDIAIEVISPSERASDTRQKLDAYLRYGTREVWQVYPKSREVMVYSGTTAVTLAAGETLTTPLLPGFSLPVQSLF